MPKAVLSNRIFLEVDDELRDSIKERLTYRIPGRTPNDAPVIIRNMGIFKKGIITMPIGRLDLIPANYDIIDKRIIAPAKFPAFAGTLRSSQQEIFDEIEDNAMINAFVSFGKTFTALAIAAKLGQKTLVVTHTIPLRTQWVREVEKVYGFTPGIIGTGKFETDTPIVIGNIQTLYKKMELIYKTFGLVLLDEMHHCSANTFSRVIDRSAARYKIGLSGTLKRKDGKDVVFKDYFGHKIFKPPAENYIEPVIHLHKANTLLPDGNLDWALRVNKVAYDPEYQKYIAAMAAYYAAKGHKVLVVADRVEFLTTCAELVGSNAISVTGADSHEDREDLIDLIRSGKKEILFGTQSIFCEGISVNELSCLILATPTNNMPLLTQLIGRIIRKLDGKQQPVVCDIKLLGNTARKQATARTGLYIEQGWRMVNV